MNILKIVSHFYLILTIYNFEKELEYLTPCRYSILSALNLHAGP